MGDWTIGFDICSRTRSAGEEQGRGLARASVADLVNGISTLKRLIGGGIYIMENE